MTAHASSVVTAPVEDAAAAGPERHVVRSYASFDEIPSVYHTLFLNADSQSFFHSLPWYKNLAATALGDKEQARILGIERESGEPIAALPLRQARLQPRAFQLRTLSSLSNYYTALYRPILDPAYPLAGALRQLAAAIRVETPAWDVINLKPLDRESPVFFGLVDAFRDSGFVVQTYFCHGNWYYPVNGRSYKEYLASLRSSVRNIASSKNKKLERTGRARVEIVTGSDGLDTAIAAYEKIYAASWKVQEPFPHFIPSLMRTCAEMGWLRLGIAYIDNQPAAAQLWIVNSGVASIYKIAYDQQYKDLSVGSYLTMRMMERTIDVDKVREVDYLSGDDRYKSDWMSHRREHWGILAMNPRTIPGTLAIARHIGGRAAKNGARKIWSIIPKRETSRRA
jgi:CelD/BcsL family acetyltransferase involved in cellulose biosynthesis